MLFKQAKNLLYRSNSTSSEPTVSDPWQIPIPVPKATAVSHGYSTPETNPALGPAGSPDAPKLFAHQSTSDEILLGDEIKLKTSASRQIEPQLEQALALIYWLKTIERPVVSS
ncbi:hypothetical protein IQ255_03050 [Pleurocapsales cyanobacterium LEGE 10410]|nr:hypothetical protein [Pleurocapsales cyanobacterium LEGE 10410]